MSDAKKALIPNSNSEDEVKITPCGRVILCTILLTFMGIGVFSFVGSINELIKRHSDYIAQNFVPDQLHLSLGANHTELYVTWTTNQFVNISELNFCLARDCEATRRKKSADIKLWRVKSSESRVMYKHTAKMDGLKLGRYYSYEVITAYDEQEYRSRSYTFRVKDINNPQATVNLAIYGDLGLVNAVSVPRLRRDVGEERYDAIIHNGDFAYDLDSNDGRCGDEFMRRMEPIAARVPYQTSVGNHEAAENFSHYDNRFTMINSGGVDNGEANNFYYSFNMGPIHFVAFSTEFYYSLKESGTIPLNNQYEWLRKDLKHASSPEQRALRPWIITFGHRPMYCSSRDRDDCVNQNNIIRKGLPFTGTYALEKLFYKYGVDVEIYSHEHQYERFLPLYDEKVFNGTDDPNDPYYNPLAPVHLISGSAGCEEELDPFKDRHAPGSIVTISDYGYTRLQATRCMLSFKQVSDDRDGYISDAFTITKTQQNFPPEHSDIHYAC